MPKQRLKAIFFYLVFVAYSLGYVIMGVIPKMHSFHVAYLVVGILICILFSTAKSFLTSKEKIMRRGLAIIIILLILQLVFEVFNLRIYFEQIKFLHLFIHIFFGLTYFILMTLLFIHSEKLYMDTVINENVFNLGEAIIFEYNVSNNKTRINISKRMQEKYNLEPRYDIPTEEFKEMINPKHFKILTCLEDLTKKHSDKEITFEMRFKEEAPYISLNVKGIHYLGKYIIWVGYDTTIIRSLQKEVDIKEKSHAKLLTNLPVGIMEIKMITDSNNNPYDYEYVYMNERYNQILNSDINEFIGKRASEKIPNQYKEYARSFGEAYLKNKQVCFDTILKINGRWQRYIAYPLENNNIVVIHQDIHDLVMVNEKLQFTLTHNPRNNLYNYEGVKKEIEKLKPQDRVAVFFTTLKNYQDIKNYYGSEYAMALVDKIANLMSYYLKRKDIAANYEEDKLLVILLNPSDNRLNKTLQSFKEYIYKQYDILETTLHAKLNVGYIIKEGPVFKEEIEDLIYKSTLASFKADEESKNIMILYKDEFSLELDRRIKIAEKMSEAINKSEIDIHFQRIIYTKDNSTVFLEALARWKDKELGVIPPEEMLKIAEDSSMNEFLNYYLMSKSIEKYAKYVFDSGCSCRLSLNIGAYFFKDENSLPFLLKEIEKHKLSTKQICLEISENTFVKDLDNIIKQINNLKELGFIIAIDDFGSKYSSLGILDVLRFDILKLDGLFVQTATSKMFEQILINLIEALHSQNKYLIIEKIETKEDAKRFIDYGCLMHQGYYYHKPEKID